MNKSFSVYANYPKPGCDTCKKESNMYVNSVWGHLCWECYGKEKARKEAERIKAFIKENS